MIVSLSVGHLRAMHEEALDALGGEPGIIAGGEEKLDSALRSTLLEVDLTQNWEPVHVASQICIRIARAHAFVDGNKRVAVLALQFVLGANGLELIEERQLELYEALIAMITHEVDEHGFEERVRNLFRPPA